MLLAASALAQSDRGTITGTIADPASAVVAGAPIEVKNSETGVVYQAATTATGNYTLKSTFKLVKTAGHDEYFGLIFGGSDLDGAAQKYVYFMVNSAGDWLIKSRDASSGETWRVVSGAFHGRIGARRSTPG